MNIQYHQASGTNAVNALPKRNQLEVAIVSVTMTGNLHNFFRFFRLRIADDVQIETRAIAEEMYNLLKPKFPICFYNFDNYQ